MKPKEIDDNQTIRVLLSFKTLKKILNSDLLSKDEYINLIMNGVTISRYSIYESNEKEKAKMEREYEKTKKRVLHKQEVKDRHAAVRRTKLSRKAMKLKED